jgi:predicted TIM-barrel fold metal-dependent hydrolase
MPRIVDFHAHIFPDRITLSPHLGSIEEMRLNFRKRARKWLRPFANTLHRAQPFVRMLPDSLRKPLDEVAMLAPVAGLLLESTHQDLKDAMTTSSVDRAIVIAHPPYLTNDKLMEICADDPKLIAAVNIPVGTERPGQVLKSLAAKGARVLKIHAPNDGEGPESPRYRALLKTASELGLPVILHTGCIHSHVLYKNPELGDVKNFLGWFKTYPELRFVLAHMNYHEPDVALDIAEKHPNIYVDTSWQPTETIGEAVRRIGAGRVLFGTDWPLVGNNIDIGIQRIRDCVDTGTVSTADAELILGKNAECLLNLPN